MSDPSRPRTLPLVLPDAARPRIAAVAAIALVVVLVLVVAVSKREIGFLRAAGPPPEASFVLPSPGAARFFAAGYNEATADVIWTRLLVYYGQETLSARNPEFAEPYVVALMTLDPMFRAPYAWAGYAIPLSTNEWIDPDNVEASIRLLRIAVARFPNDSEMHGMLGYNLAYELPRWIDDRDRIARAKIEGAEHLRIQAALGGVPAWMALSASRALEDASLGELAARNLEEAAYTTDDPKLRQRILLRLASIQATADVEAIARSVTTLEAVRAAQARYVPQSLFLLTSPARALDRMSQGLVPPALPELDY